MTDRFLFAATMICLMLGGALAIGSDVVRDHERARVAQLREVRLETVTVTAKRLAASAAVAVTERDAPATTSAQ